MDLLIGVTLGLSRSLVIGDGPNFATASVSLQKMLVMIREIKQATRNILAWISDWVELKDYKSAQLPFYRDLTPKRATRPCYSSIYDIP